jgi:hypothetical protein
LNNLSLNILPLISDPNKVSEMTLAAAAGTGSQHCNLTLAIL